ncbi:MAG: AbrB/MazE/SpoVT family DNA-binding domain-containing protein [Anaerolineales bacterium]
MTTTKVSSKGWVVIPKPLRDEFGLEPGTHVKVVAYGGVLAVIPQPDDPVEALHGMLESGPSLTEDLLAERARDKAKEEAALE